MLKHEGGLAGRRSAWLIFGLMVLVLNAPNLIPWEKNLYPGSYIFDLLERLLKCALLASMFLSVFSRPWVAWVVSWLLFLCWLPASLAVRWISDAPITANLVGMALASSPGELRNLAQSVPSAVFAMFIGWNLACAAVTVLLRKKSAWRWGGVVRAKIFVLCALLLLVPSLTRPAAEQALVAHKGSILPHDPFAEADREVGSDAALPRAFPYELPWAIAQYLQARQVVDAAHAGLTPTPQSHALVADARSPDIVVLVIGESSSRKAWQVFNPQQHATTPKIARRLTQGPGLYLFSNVVAQSNSTRLAVPSMLTPQPLLWSNGAPNPNATESIVALATKAGYSSAWFSNQAAVGRFDGVIAAYADEASSTAFLNPSSFFQQGTYDEVLLPALRRHLLTNPRAFVVLHTMGSHFKFSQRYPPGFGPFPDGLSVEQTYFNSIAYTDALLDQTISTLEQDGRSAVLVYVSDHGQGLADPVCKKTDLNRVTADSYEVPALVWLSSAYAVAHPSVPQALHTNATVPYTTAAVHQTLRDLIAGEAMGLRAVDDSTSFLRSQALDAPQWIASPDLRKLNFREAVNKDRCFIGVH